MTIAEFDRLDNTQKKSILLQCCGSVAWAEKIIAALPAEDLIDLLQIAEDEWYACTKNDWREAFSHHPKIGDLDSLKEKFSSAADEQASVKQASDKTLQALAEANKEYEERFGYIFIVNATGKSADEMLENLQSRLTNNSEEELNIAAEEQLKITRIRLEKLFTT